MPTQTEARPRASSLPVAMCWAGESCLAEMVEIAHRQPQPATDKPDADFYRSLADRFSDDAYAVGDIILQVHS